MEELIIIAFFASWAGLIPILWGIVSAIKKERYDSMASRLERDWERHKDSIKVAFWPLMLIYLPLCGIYKLFFFITDKVKRVWTRKTKI